MESEKSLTFGVQEMSCASCVGRVEKALQAVDGVHEAQVNLASESATIRADGSLKAGDLALALENAGYPAEVNTFRFSIENMTCASCVGRVERALADVSGVVSADVNLAKEEATVRVIGTSVSPSDIIQTSNAAGYPATLVTDQGSRNTTDDRKAEEAAHFLSAE